jgi:hypothetical protein
MPIDVIFGTKKVRLNATNEWKKSDEKIATIEDVKVLTTQFYVKVN